MAFSDDLLSEKQVDKQTPNLKMLTDLLCNSNMDGKKIRGVLICLGYELSNNSFSNKLYAVAAAYEILHTSLLIHDDIMDKSLLRRGNPTIYQSLGGKSLCDVSGNLSW